MVVPAVEAELDASRTSVVLFGIETHICVQQTALDLIERGIEVHIVVRRRSPRTLAPCIAPHGGQADGVSSRSPQDRSVAIERMRASGAFISTHESLLFECATLTLRPDGARGTGGRSSRGGRLMRDARHPQFKGDGPGSQRAHGSRSSPAPQKRRRSCGSLSSRRSSKASTVPRRRRR